MKNLKKVEFITLLAQSQCAELGDIYNSYSLLGGELSQEEFEKIISDNNILDAINCVGFMYNEKKEQWVADSTMIKYFNNVFGK